MSDHGCEWPGCKEERDETQSNGYYTTHAFCHTHMNLCAMIFEAGRTG